MRIIALLVFLGAISIFYSCKEEDCCIVNSLDRSNERTHLEMQMKNAFASSKNGWVMMVKPDLNTDTYTPIVLKFDTLTNRLYIKTVYGLTAESETYYRMEGSQLSFATGSIMNTLYRMGSQASDLTDHVFNVLEVSTDTISIQSYRNGVFGSREGGVIHKLFKRPDSWKWADDEIHFDYASPSFQVNLTALSPIGQMTLKYVNDISERVTPWRFRTWSTQTIEAMRLNDPFSLRNNISGGGFRGIYPMIITAIDGGGLRPSENVTAILGHNAISLLPFVRSATTNEAPRALGMYLKTHYLVFKGQERINRSVKMEFEAYNKKGETIITALYNNNQ